jgi:BPG-independent PGAM N-terminus (iPGM_N)
MQLQSGDIFKHKGWEGLKPAFEKNTLHFIGLLSDGGVHSRYDQLLLCLQGALLQTLWVPFDHAPVEYRQSQCLCLERLEKGMCCMAAGPGGASLLVQGLRRRAPRSSACTRLLTGARPPHSSCTDQHPASVTAAGSALPAVGKRAIQGLVNSLWRHYLVCRRDVQDGTSVDFIERLQNDLADIQKQNDGCDARIASGGGRMRVTMDRYEVCFDEI